LDRVVPPQTIDDLPSQSFLSTSFPTTTYLAALVAGATVISPLLPRAWRSLAWAAVWLTIFVRVVTAVQAPVNIAVTFALGGVVGTAMLVAFGSPLRRPGAASLRAMLEAAGLSVDDLRDEASLTGRRTYVGTTSNGPIVVTYADQDDRDAALLSQLIRAVRVHSVDDDTLSVQPDRRVAHQGLTTAMARRADVRTPDVVAVAPAGPESAVIALEKPTGTALADVGDPDDIAAAALVDVWRQLDRLHAARIAHRSLTRHHVYVDGDTASIVDLEYARLTASDDQLAVDAAELLVSTALTVGVDRALDAATVDERPILTRSLAFIQPAALPAAARRAIRKDKDLLEALRNGLQERLDVPPVELEQLDRISVAKLVSWVGFAVLAFFVLGLATSWSEITDAMSGANWWWAIPVLIVTLLGTVGGAMSLSGSVVRPVPLGEATVIMFGQSFLNRFTPMNAGGMAMRIRYLQKGGTDGTVATAAIGLTSAASGVMQVVFIAFFFLWSTSDPTAGISLSGGDESGSALSTIIAVFVVAVVIAGVLVAATPRLRTWLVGFVRSTRDKIRRDFGELARRPAKLMLLFGGAGLSKLTTIVAFVAACRAFDIDLSFAELGALYLGANTVASAVPTPGGVGAIEAALVLVLTNAGVEDATAWAAVLLFRLINFWFPTIPGYLALRISERRELI
ncbi:MAG: flippase-like domain-containing protein, partial [Actinomycetota bacterium]